MQSWRPPNSLFKDETQNLFRDHQQKLGAPKIMQNFRGPKLGPPKKICKVGGPRIVYLKMGRKICSGTNTKKLGAPYIYFIKPPKAIKLAFIYFLVILIKKSKHSRK